jgi:hypothetical protein
MADQNEYTITPLGAAIVEALPDRTKKRRIQRRFKEHGECPASSLFSATEVEQWCRERGEKVTAVDG